MDQENPGAEVIFYNKDMFNTMPCVSNTAHTVGV